MLTNYDTTCLAAAASTKGLTIDPETIGPMSYQGMLALVEAVVEIPNRPFMTSQFKLDIRAAWRSGQRTS